MSSDPVKSRISASRQQRRAVIKRMWDEGAKMRDIATELGSTTGSVSVEMTMMRKAGIALAPRKKAFAETAGIASWDQRLAAIRARPGYGAAYRSSRYEYLVAGDPCAYCGAPAHTVDHITPFSAGGQDEADNVTAACMACNVAKRGLPLLSFLLWRRLRLAIMADWKQANLIRARKTLEIAKPFG